MAMNNEVDIKKLWSYDSYYRNNRLSEQLMEVIRRSRMLRNNKRIGGVSVSENTNSPISNSINGNFKSPISKTSIATSTPAIQEANDPDRSESNKETINNSLSERNETLGSNCSNSSQAQGSLFNNNIPTSSSPHSSLGASVYDYKNEKLYSYSPFYSTRTTLGGSYRNRNMGRRWPTSSSRMDLFSPWAQTAVSMQPVFKKKSGNVTKGDKVRSASILERIEKCRSMINEAIIRPTNDLFDKKAIDVTTSSNVSPKKEIKQPLLSLWDTVVLPCDRLHIKWIKPMQKSVSSTDQVTSSNGTASVVSSQNDIDSTGESTDY